MPIIEQIDKNNNDKIEFNELQDSLKTGGILFDLETDTSKQNILKSELETIDTDIEKTFINLINIQKDIILKKNKTDRTDWEKKLLVFYYNNKSKIDDYTSSADNTNDIETLKYDGKSTWDIIENTKLGQQKEMTEELSNKLDATWYVFIDSYGLEGISDVEKQQLAVGVSFAFMDWYNQNKPDKTNTDGQGGQSLFLSKITKYSNILNRFSGGGMNMLGGLIGGLGQYSADLPLDGFFKKIQNSINIIKKNNKSDKFKKILNPSKFVSFFQGVEDTKFLNNKEISNKYFDTLNLTGVDLTTIANMNGEKFDNTTIKLLKDVIDKAGPVLNFKKEGRKTILGIYDQLQGVFSQISGIAKTLGFDFGSVKEFLNGLGPIGDMAFAVLGFNGVDGFVQDYWLDKLGGGLDKGQQDFVDYATSYYRENISNYNETKMLKSDGTETTNISEIDYIQTFRQSDSFFSKIGGTFTEQGSGGEKVLIPNLLLSAEVAGVNKPICDKIPLSYKLVKDSIQNSLDKNYPDKSLEVDENKINEISKIILSDQDFVYEFASNPDLGQDDFVSALVGSYIMSIKPQAGQEKPIDYAKAISVGAIGYNYVQTLNLNNNIQSKQIDQNNPTNQVNETTEFSELEINQQNYINSVYNKIKDKKYIKKMGETKFKEIATKIFEEANKYDETKNIVPYIFAQIEQESQWNIDAHAITGEDSYGLMQINISSGAHPDYDGGCDTNKNLEYGIRFLANCIKQKGNIKDGFDQYNGGENFKLPENQRYSYKVLEKYKRTYLPEYFGKNNLEQLKGQKIENMGMIGNSHIGGLGMGGIFDKTYLTQGVTEITNGTETLQKGQDLLRKNGGKISDLYDGDNLKQGVQDYFKNINIKSVLLFFGGNEASANIVGNKYKTKLEKLISDIKKINPDIKPILVCSPLNSQADNSRKGNNEIVRKFAEENNYALFDFENEFVDDEFKDKSDGTGKDVHLKKDGYVKMAKIIESAFIN